MRARARGESRLERVLSLVLLGDLVSVYLAALEGVDPMPVEAIERLKSVSTDTDAIPCAAGRAGCSGPGQTLTRSW